MENEKKLRIRIENLSLAFGGVQALSEINLDISDKEILAVIGPNGAGKTCILNCINGFYKPQKGEIYFDGQKLPGYARTRPPSSASPGHSRISSYIRAEHAGQHHGRAARPDEAELPERGAVLRPCPKEEIEHRRDCRRYHRFPRNRADQVKAVGVLPYGMRKRVELGRALALEPKVLLLDEPMAGMNLEEKEDIARFIVDIFEGQGATYPDTPVLRDGISCIVLVEHDMGVVMDLADRIAVLDFGRKIAEGTPEEIRVNPQVVSAYLGKEA